MTTRAYRHWTATEEAILRKLHGTMTHTALALQLDRRPDTITNKLRRMGLESTPGKRPLTSARPGIKQIAKPAPKRAPVTIGNGRGPAYLPGAPIIPATAKITRQPATPDPRYTPGPDQLGLGLAGKRPGEYSESPRAWAMAAATSLASRGA